MVLILGSERSNKCTDLTIICVFHYFVCVLQLFEVEKMLRTSTSDYNMFSYRSDRNRLVFRRGRLIFHNFFFNN